MTELDRFARFAPLDQFGVRFKQTVELLVSRQLDPVEDPLVDLVDNLMHQRKIMSQFRGFVTGRIEPGQDVLANVLNPPNPVRSTRDSAV